MESTSNTGQNLYDDSEARPATLVSTVMKLMEKYLCAGKTFCTGNSYATKLLEQQTHLVGMLRSNRHGLPKVVTAAQLKKGEVVTAPNDAGITVHGEIQGMF